jgi:hypothetical protein
MAVIPGQQQRGNAAPKGSKALAAVEIEGFRPLIYTTMNAQKQWNPGDQKALGIVDVKLFFVGEDYPIVLRDFRIVANEKEGGIYVFEPQNRIPRLPFREGTYKTAELPYSISGAITKAVKEAWGTAAQGQIHEDWWKFWGDLGDEGADVLKHYEELGYPGWVDVKDNGEPAGESDEEDEGYEEEEDEEEAPPPPPARKARTNPTPAPAPAAPAKASNSGGATPRPSAPAPAPASAAKPAPRTASKPGTPGSTPPSGTRVVRKPATEPLDDEMDDPFED